MIFSSLWKLIKKLFAGTVEDVFYICNGTTVLPEKLSTEEEADVLKRLSVGEHSARQELIERNLRLVVYTSQKFNNTNINMDDLVSVGTIGLIKAVGSFDVTKNIKFATYASRCIENEILMQLRKSVKTRGDISLDEPLSTDKDGNQLKVSDILGTESDTVGKQIEKREECEFLLTAIEKLNHREKLIMKLRYGLIENKELTQKEVAEQLNISQSYISRLEKKILIKLRKEIISTEIISI